MDKWKVKKNIYTFKIEKVRKLQNKREKRLSVPSDQFVFAECSLTLLHEHDRSLPERERERERELKPLLQIPHILSKYS